MAPLGFTIDYYAILQIPEDADDNTIKASYKRLALAKHPDRNRTLDTTAQFQTLQEAYEVLKDTNRRKCFDAELSRIRREAAPRNGAASNRESNYDVHSQTPQSYAYAIYAQEKKLQAFAIDLENLFKDLQSNRQDVDKHRVVLRRIEAKDAEAMRADAERSGWRSFLTMSGYSSSELLERKRAAAVRLSNRRDLEEIIRDLEAKRGFMVAKIHSLNDEIRRATDVKRQLVAAQRRQQAAAASLNAEEQRRENMRQKQYEEELQRRQREEQSEKEREKKVRKEREEAEAKEKKFREELLKKEREFRDKKEKDRHTRPEEQQAPYSKLDKRGKKKQPNSNAQQPEEQSKSKHKSNGRNSKNQQGKRSEPKTTPSNVHQKHKSMGTESVQSCQHRKFWTKTEGRIQCERCHMRQNLFAFSCPGCQMTACSSCRDTLKRGAP